MIEINKIAQANSDANYTLADNSHSVLSVLSREFSALCQAQVSLLIHSFNVTWVGIYLTEDGSKENRSSTELIPAYFYPHTDFNMSFSSQQENQVLLLLNEHYQGSEKKALPQYLESSINLHEQLVVPLLYEDIFMGLLVIRRNEGIWNDIELTQIENIANSLAIACSLEKEKNWYQKRLQELKQVRNFTDNKIDNLIHQLRNPLTALRTFAKLLLKRILPEDGNNKIVDNILRESSRLQDLLEQFERENHTDEEILELEGIAEIKNNFLLPGNGEQKGDVIEIVKGLLEGAIAIAEDKNIKIQGQLPEHPLLVKGNPQAIREVVSNIIDNAIKYTPEAGQIEIQLKEQGQNLGIEIADNGYGIPPADQQRIFERNYRGVQELGKISGTGLGLAIAKELVEQMGGEIELISPNEKDGTTFIIWLKLVQ
jgi:signal transduction histidine kinase